MLRRKSYLLGVLFVIYVFSGVDSITLGLVQQDIKRELFLTDTQLGLLTGIAFTLTYCLAGIAVARWADRGDRVAIISLSVAVWSLLTAACGTATNFVQLFLLRAGVGLGEAGCWPASQSLIADYFDPTERPRAYALYSLGAGVIYLVGYGLSGWLSQLYGWRVMFMMLGLPGVALAVLAWFTLREPRFECHNTQETGWFVRFRLKMALEPSAPPRFKDAAITLWSNTTLRHVLLFWSVVAFVNSALVQWQSAFFVRSHAQTTGELGTWFAVAYGFGGMAGVFLGGEWASRYAANNERMQLRVGSVACCALMVLSIFIYLVPNAHVAFGLLCLYVILMRAYMGPFWAMMQTLVPGSMRATAAAVTLLLASLTGGLGSLATGALSDALRTWFGEGSLRCALLVLCPGYLWAGWHLWRASKYVTHDRERHRVSMLAAVAIRTP